MLKDLAAKGSFSKLIGRELRRPCAFMWSVDSLSSWSSGPLEITVSCSSRRHDALARDVEVYGVGRIAIAYTILDTPGNR
jgi:hypothetical protein